MNEEITPEDGKTESQEEVNETTAQEQAIKQTDTTNQTSDIATSDIQNMEVHHHPIPHKAGEKKNFKEYFLEFLMIFLAVTLGFFAENIRENSAEREHEKQY